MTNTQTTDTETARENTRLAAHANSVLLELGITGMATADSAAGAVTLHLATHLPTRSGRWLCEDVWSEVFIQTHRQGLSVSIGEQAQECDGCKTLVPADTLTRTQSDQIDYTTPVFENFCQTCCASDEHA